MANVRREDLQMKIPALLHLSRLGYGYLPRAQLRRRDRTTNILPEELRAAVERINRVRISEADTARLTAALREELSADDLGRQFYGTIRNGWDGLRLIDFEHPENNRFQSASELACGSGAGSFRPDITLYVNGLPLAMAEVKTAEKPRGLQAEYDRMVARLRSEEGRRYLQCAQIWAFSNDAAADPNRLMMTDGAYFAAVTAENFPVYAPQERNRRGDRKLLPLPPGEERTILEDNGILTLPRTRGFRRDLSPGKTTHRMLTALFRPERFLFLLRYGIRFIEERVADGEKVLTRRMLTTGQLAALGTLAGKAERGFKNWTLPAGGAAGEQAANASLIALLEDLVPGAEICWVSADERQRERDWADLAGCGVSCGRPEDAEQKELTLITADRAPEICRQENGRQASAGRRVYILPRAEVRYGQKQDYAAEIRRRDPEAILISRATNLAQESMLPPDPNALYYSVAVTVQPI